jgi:threonine dehydrogenase-like Zn-dependent dehydrogenase
LFDCWLGGYARESEKFPEGGGDGDGGGAAGSAAGLANAGHKGIPIEARNEPEKSVAATDHIQIALIGPGGQGQYDAQTAVQVSGVKLIAAADCYDGRLQHAKELWGADIQTTRDYREILERKDVDAVIVGTPDHWHKQVSSDRSGTALT